jgi:hypothetical protein
MWNVGRYSHIAPCGVKMIGAVVKRQCVMRDGREAPVCTDVATRSQMIMMIQQLDWICAATLNHAAHSCQAWTTGTGTEATGTDAEREVESETMDGMNGRMPVWLPQLV